MVRWRGGGAGGKVPWSDAANMAVVLTAARRKEIIEESGSWNALGLSIIIAATASMKFGRILVRKHSHDSARHVIRTLSVHINVLYSLLPSRSLLVNSKYNSLFLISRTTIAKDLLKFHVLFHCILLMFALQIFPLHANQFKLEKLK